MGTASIAWLSLVNHKRSLRPSSLLSLYLSALVILDIARVRTLWLMGLDTGEAAALTVTLALTTVALILESAEKKSSLKQDELSGAPEEYSGFWTRTAFTWLVSTFKVGYTKVITVEDLPILDSRLRSQVLRERLVRTWARCKSCDLDRKLSLIQSQMIDMSGTVS